MSLEIKTYPQLKVYTELLELPRDLLIEMLTMLKDGQIVYTDLVPSQLAINKYKLEEYQNQVYMTDTSGSSPLSNINIYNNIRDLIISAFNVKLNRSTNDNIVSMNISDENVYKLNLVSKLSDTLTLEELEQKSKSNIDIIKDYVNALEISDKQKNIVFDYMKTLYAEVNVL
jgi:hypothetical protein